MWYAIVLTLFTIVVVESDDSFRASRFYNDNPCKNPADFQCYNGKCIAAELRCNNKNDCLDKSDEVDCDVLHCLPPRFFKCLDSHKCISSAFRCDNVDDCPSGDDEINCNNTTNGDHIRDCGIKEFTCDNKMCIPKHLVCNGKKNCADGSDEKNCKSDINSCEGFLCDNDICLESMTWLCDGKDDCGDGSDEKHCTPGCTAEHNRFLCKDEQDCISLDKVCDDNKDCTDGSDEGDLCKDDKCKAKNCPDKCHNLPSGAVCFCSDGYEYNNQTNKCVDINECEIYGTCSQSCENSIGSFQCKCVDKFKLKPDNRTCMPYKDAVLLYTTKDTVAGISMNTDLEFIVAKGLSNVIGVNFDGTHVYWTDITYKTESIIRALYNGDKREVIFSSGLSKPEDLAVDWLTGNIYFTDSEYHHVAVCSNDGFKCLSLIRGQNDHNKPRGILLNPSDGVLYWSDWGEKPMIAKASMDGTNLQPFVTENIHWPNCLCLDWPNSRIYWTDAKLKTIESVDLNGNNRKIVLKDVLKQPYGIAVFDDRIFWSDWGTKNIQSADKFTGKNREIVVQNKKIYALHVYHAGLMPHSSYPCKDNDCSHLCLINSNKTFTCACPKGMALSQDKTTCRTVEKEKQLLIGVGNYLILFRPQLFGRHDQVRGTIYPFYISKTAYNSLTGQVFVADNVQRIIYLVDYQTKEALELVKTGVENVSSLAFDYLANNLYWSDSERCTVEVMSMNNLQRAIVSHYMGTEVPIAISVIPEHGSMFVALRSNGHTHIDRQTLHGRGTHYHMHEEGLGSDGHFAFVLDNDLQVVFWSDQDKNRIESTNYEGTMRHAYKSKSLKRPVSIAIVGDKLYWTSAKSSKLYYGDKHDLSKIKTLIIDRPPLGSYPDEITLSEIGPVRMSDHLCIRVNGGCSHVCVSTGKYTSACICPPGMVFSDKTNLTCIYSRDCDFRCDSGECLPLSKKCDQHIDCADSSDEKHCTDEELHEVMCSFDQFRCEDGSKCIDQSHRCDHHVDCIDKSDENDCNVTDPHTKCRNYQHACKNGLCIDATGLCDGYNDCGDNSDEMFCDKRKCGKNMFQCTNFQCIKIEWECDAFNDCIDGSDEHNLCPYVPCDKGFTKCKSGLCVQDKLVCDGKSDCDDHSDEDNCDDNHNKLYECDDDDNDGLPKSKFACTSAPKICLDISARCNGTAECPRGEDEKNCTSCAYNEFECANKLCVLDNFRCDNEDDCGDGSDEFDCTGIDHSENHKELIGSKRDCSDEMFDCKDGSCIDMIYLCDGIEHCSNGLDENGKCNASCSNNPCEQKCHKTPYGPVCGCEAGYKLAGNHKHCEDINECRQLNPCAQKCENTIGSYRCSCFANYMLRNDKTTCKSFGGNQFMIYSTLNQIRKISQNPPAISILHELNDTDITGLDIDVHRNLLYFTVEEIGTLFELNLTSNAIQYVTLDGNPEKISVDWITNNVYIIDKYAGMPSITMCSMISKGCSKLIQFKFREIVNTIAVDPINKMMFYSLMHLWIFGQPDSSIYKANLDGTRREVLIKNMFLVSAISYDYNKKMVYFTNSKTQSLHSVRYDGTEHRILVRRDSSIVKPNSINIFEDHAYILNDGSPAISQCTLFGHKKCIGFELNALNAENLVIDHQSRQKVVDNVCAEHKCTVTCVAAELGPKCLCHSGTQTVPSAICNDIEVHGNIGPRFRSKGLDPYESTGVSGWVICLMLLFVTTVLIAGFLFYRKKIQHGKFNISMHFQNPRLNNLDSAQVKMVNPPEILCSRHRTEITMPSMNGAASGGVTTTPIFPTNRGRYFSNHDSNIADNISMEDDTDSLDDNPRSRLIL